MVTIAICEDEVLWLNTAKSIVYQAAVRFEPELRLFSSSEELLRAVNAGYQPDIAVLDLVLRESRGIETANELRRACPYCAIIFMTAFISGACRVYETEGSYYILKSQFRERVAEAIERALEDQRARSTISFRVKGAVQSVPAKDVLYLERSLKKTLIICANGERHATSAKPGDILDDAKIQFFVKCHQSFYVNLYQVFSMTADSFIMSGGQKVPISRSCRQQARDAFHAIRSR